MSEKHTFTVHWHEIKNGEKEKFSQKVVAGMPVEAAAYISKKHKGAVITKVKKA